MVGERVGGRVPDPGDRAGLRAPATATDAEREACDEAAEAGLSWRPIRGAQGSQPPYELRPGTGRRGPAEDGLADAVDAEDREAAGQQLRRRAR